VLFRLGGVDAALLEPEFSPPFSALDLTSLERYHVVVKLLARGENLTPFSARTLLSPPRPPETVALRDRLLDQSRARFCQPRHEVEAAIAQSLAASERPR
jgi:hypothetical protein